MVKRLWDDNPNLQLEVVYTFWLDKYCLKGPNYCAYNYELLEDFSHREQDLDWPVWWLKQEELDTLLAWSGFQLELTREGIIWYGVCPILPDYIPDDGSSPFREFPKFYE